MAVGTKLGEPCGRSVRGLPTPRCPGTITVVAQGTDHRGKERQSLGCTTCWHTMKPTISKLVDRPLFGGDS